MHRLSTFLLVVTSSMALAACDGNGPDGKGGSIFSVRYEARGTCNGIIGANMVSVGYTVDGGGSEGKTVTTPWSETFTIDASTTFGGAGITVICLGSGNVSNTVTAEIFVGGVSGDIDTVTAAGTITANANAVLQ